MISSLRSSTSLHPLRRPYIAGVLLGAGAVLLLGAGALGQRLLGPGPYPHDALAVAPATPPCSVPSPYRHEALDDDDRSWLFRRTLACLDHHEGRLSADDYRAAVWTAGATVQATPVVWASIVLAVSSQYTASEWSASRALGPPDVAVPGTDDVNAWASLSADDQPEFIEVGFDQPRRIAGVEVLETLSPGAVTAIQLITRNRWGLRVAAVYPGDGRNHEVVYQRGAAPMPEAWFRHRAAFECTDEEVIGVRVTLASRAVPGWSEIDAIGVQPCGD
jgi:hypothetical protein